MPKHTLQLSVLEVCIINLFVGVIKCIINVAKKSVYVCLIFLLLRFLLCLHSMISWMVHLTSTDLHLLDYVSGSGVNLTHVSGAVGFNTVQRPHCCLPAPTHSLTEVCYCLLFVSLYKRSEGNFTLKQTQVIFILTQIFSVYFLTQIYAFTHALNNMYSLSN